MSIENWISSAETAILAARATLVAPHFTQGSEQAYVGKTDSDYTGWTVVYVDDADEAFAEVGGTTVNQQKRILLDFDGLSTASTSTITCLAASELTANAAVDWGYNRPDWEVVIEPAPGRSPVISTTTFKDIDLVGAHRVHFKGVGLACSVTTRFNSYFPGIGILAVTGNTFDGELVDQPMVTANGNRVAHIEGNTFLKCQSTVLSIANYCRMWNNIDMGHRDNDIYGTRGYESWQSGWTSHSWSAGWRVFDMDGTVTPTGLHPDFHQIHTFDDAHQGYNNLIEFNIIHMNGRRRVGGDDGYQAQGCFGNMTATGGGSLAQDCNWLIHNNVMAIGAWWCFHMPDPQDNGFKIAYRNMGLRCATGWDTVDDSYPYVFAERGTDHSTGSGYAIIKENYVPPKDWSGEASFASNQTISNNIDLMPRASAATGTGYDELLKGTDGNGAGFANGDYTSPDAGVTDPDTAETAFLAIVEPQVGWRGASVGPMDPATFPTDFQTLQAGQPPTLPIMGRNITINLTAGA